MRPDSFIRLYRATQRTILANLMLFRHSGSFIFRNASERYWAMRSVPRRSESHLLCYKRILLSGCLLSFAQDKISDDEVIRSVKGFCSAYPTTTQSPSVNDIPDDVNNTDSSPSNPVNLEGKVTNTTTVCSAPSICDPGLQETLPDSSDRFFNPPLTVFVRQIKSKFVDHFLRSADLVMASPLLSTANDVQVFSDGLEEQETQADQKYCIGSHISSLLAELHFRPDGTGFVDESWELVIDRDNLHLWRRPLKVTTLFMEKHSGHPPNDANKYEYRVCGTLNDVSALSFLEVQLNLAYRRSWDDKIVSLEYLPRPARHTTTENQNSLTECEAVHWVARFPFPLANREYIYTRRWWLESSGSPCDTGRHAIVLSRSLISHDTVSALDKTAGTTGSPPTCWSDRLRPASVSVAAYRSDMLIESHNRFDELGMNYYLVYYDDPCLPLSGNSKLGFISSTTISHFMNQLHSAALKLDRLGRLPDDIRGVVFQPKSNATMADCISRKPVKTGTTSSTSTDNKDASSKDESSTLGTGSRKSSSKRRFFTDPAPEDSNLSATVC